MKVRKEQIRLKQKGDKLILLIDSQQQAIVRKNAVNASDWEKLLNTLTI
ncbi:hypothetical protein [Chitinophaga tropicalis]|uniref:Uncharacterized protein n=1 Tax=Chitinophaga tropicalis TaxID=2683588 RepID=A0A7K1U515_9BACT|nr:hypothetical protein [Chitinophaga tropicalis]MVT09462.1 hypothetical protein [Chitinophaga tropicalis]